MEKFKTDVAPVVMSVLITAAFAMVLYLMLAKPIPLDANQTQLVGILVGVLAGAFTTVVQYWMGSSAGSRSKDAIIAQRDDGNINR